MRPPNPAPLRRAFMQALNEALAGGAGILLPAGFFTGAALLAAFSVGADPVILAETGPGVLWVALALSSLVTLERIFQADLQDGALDLWLQEDIGPSIIALVRTLAHWIVSGLPLVLLTPLLGLMLYSPAELIFPAMLSYALGGLTFYLWGGVAAALSAGVARSGLLISLIALPLYIPPIIFGMMSLQEGVSGSAILFLGANCLFALAIAPFAMGTGLRLAAD